MVVSLYMCPGWTGGLSRVSPAFALCQMGLAPAPRDPNEDKRYGWIISQSILQRQEWIINPM